MSLASERKRTRQTIHMLLALMLLGLVVGSLLAACGEEEDLFFPGSIPPTIPSASTATPDEEE